jgi:hypothetical protein
LDTKGCTLRSDIVQFYTACLRQLYVAMKFWARQNIAAIIKKGEGREKNKEISNATKEKSVCGGWRDNRRCVRTAVMPKQVT